MTHALGILWQVVASLLTAGVMAVVIRRILAGVGWIRTVVVSLIVLVSVVPVSTVVGKRMGIFTADGGLAVSWAVAAVVSLAVVLWVFASALLVLVLLEIVVPTGSVPGPVEAIKGIGRTSKRMRRYMQLSWILTKTGLGAMLRGGPSAPGFGDALVALINQAGVTFVKMGQILSTRGDLLPEPVVKSLSSLRENAAPSPPSDVRAMLEREWGRPVDEVFSSFEEKPFAAASTAQVHAAKMRDGRHVVVKVLRPGARAQVAVDSDILMRFTQILESRFEWARGMGVADLGKGLVKSLTEEMDYRREASNTQAVRRALAGHHDIVVPEIDTELSTRDVLVMTRLHGKSAADAAEGLPVERRRELAEDLMQATLEGILVNGVFHADLHPGNILVLDDGRLGLLDFGTIGVIDSETRQLLAAIMLSLVADDSAAATTAVTMAFDVDDTVDRRELQRGLGRVMTLLAQSGAENAAVFQDLFGVLRENWIGVPGDVAGAFRTLTSLDGTMRALVPDGSLFGNAKGRMAGLLKELAAPSSIVKSSAATALTSAVVLKRMPGRAERITDQLARGELTIHSRALSATEDRRWVRSMLDDALSAVFAVVAIAMATVFLIMPGGDVIVGQLTAYHLVAYLLGFCGFVLVLRLLIRIFMRARQ